LKRIITGSFAEIKNVANKGLFHLFTANGLIYILGFASQLFVAGLLSPVDIGRIKIMQAYIGLTSLGVGLGFNTSLIKLAADLPEIKEKAKLLKLCLLVSVASFIFFYGMLFLLNHYALVSSDPAIISLFPYYILFLLPLGMQSMFLSYYQAQKNIKKMATLQFYAKAVSVVFIIAFTFYLGLQGYILAVIITGMVTIFLLFIGLDSSTRLSFNKSYNFDIIQLKKLWKVARFVLLANILGNLLTSVDIYIVNYLIKDREAVGYYMFALTLVGVLSIVPTTIQQIAFPFFSEKSQGLLSWHQSYIKYNKINHIFIMIVGLMAVVFVPVLVKIAFAGKYNASIFFFVLLVFAWILNALNGMKGTALMGMGKFNLNMIGGFISLLVSLPIMLGLTYFWKIEGAVYSKIIAGLISYIISFMIFKKYLTKSQKIIRSKRDNRNP
jgi:O-antigen/teichoic acid export membrane protein